MNASAAVPPHAVAPELIGWAENVDTCHCVWKRQPQTAEEIEDAIGVILVSELACHRYAKDDQRVIDRLGWEFCDSPLRTVPAGPVNCDPPPPPNFGQVATGSLFFGRIIAALRAIFRI
jgi:hypothetical protein